MSDAPILVWFRRDLRLDDLPMLDAAIATGRPLIPVFIADETVTGIGAAAKWRWGEGLRVFAQRLEALGARLVLRRGAAASCLRALLAETGATSVYWTRRYEADAIARDSDIKESFKAQGIDVQSFSGTTLIEPWQVKTGSGTPFKVFTPFWKALSALGVSRPVPAPTSWRSPEAWPNSDALDDWGLDRAMNRGALVLDRYSRVGEEAALQRLDAFLDVPVQDYAEARDLPAKPATSGLSEPLAYGEISPRRIWHAALAHEETAASTKGLVAFRRELAWRDFAHHLIFAAPDLPTICWRKEWEGFTWRADNDDAERWRQARTGEPIVDAGLREMFVTGKMHNRLRMIVASYLTKHLQTDWRVGLAWFADCLTDWDPASNAMGWQWVAGCGPDASPYFRVFNPATQAEKFDKHEGYRRKFLAETVSTPSEHALAYFDAVPRSWNLDPKAPYPAPMVDLAQGRKRALAAYERFKES